MDQVNFGQYGIHSHCQALMARLKLTMTIVDSTGMMDLEMGGILMETQLLVTIAVLITARGCTMDYGLSSWLQLHY